MSKRFLISVAAIALMAGAGAVNAQGTKSEGGGPRRRRRRSGCGPDPKERGHGTRQGGAGNDMKSGQAEKSPGASKNQRAEEPKSGGK